MVEIGIAQYAPGQDKNANLRQLADVAGQAAGRGAQLLVAPEFAMFTATSMDHRYVESAEPIDGPFVTALIGLARERQLIVVAGINEAHHDRIFNTIVAVGPHGLLCHYRKIHLYDAYGFRESAVVAAGPIVEPATFALGGLTFGLQTCFDLRFPEVTRRIVDAGADVLLLPAQWVPGPLKEEHWSTLIRARAIENTMYVAAADQCAPTGAGRSMLVDPMGVVVAALGEAAGLAVGSASAQRVAAVRRINPALGLRRFGVVER